MISVIFTSTMKNKTAHNFHIAFSSVIIKSEKIQQDGGGVSLQFNKNERNPSVVALKEAQKAFQGAAEELGIKDEQDVVALVKEIRKTRQGAETHE